MTSPAGRRILQEIARILGVILGATISALGYSLFQVPYNIAAGGVSGLAIMINHFTGWPVGLMILVMNAPLMILGYPIWEGGGLSSAPLWGSRPSRRALTSCSQCCLASWPISPLRKTSFSARSMRGSSVGSASGWSTGQAARWAALGF